MLRSDCVTTSVRNYELRSRAPKIPRNATSIRTAVASCTCPIYGLAGQLVAQLRVVAVVLIHSMDSDEKLQVQTLIRLIPALVSKWLHNRGLLVGGSLGGHLPPPCNCRLAATLQFSNSAISGSYFFMEISSWGTYLVTRASSGLGDNPEILNPIGSWSKNSPPFLIDRYICQYLFVSCCIEPNLSISI